VKTTNQPPIERGLMRSILADRQHKPALGGWRLLHESLGHQVRVRIGCGGDLRPSLGLFYMLNCQPRMHRPKRVNDFGTPGVISLVSKRV
jgi:hypothetical protein